jgi:hypothetical protein
MAWGTSAAAPGMMGSTLAGGRDHSPSAGSRRWHGQGGREGCHNPSSYVVAAAAYMVVEPWVSHCPREHASSPAQIACLRRCHHGKSLPRHAVDHAIDGTTTTS